MFDLIPYDEHNPAHIAARLCTCGTVPWKRCRHETWCAVRATIPPPDCTPAMWQEFLSARDPRGLSLSHLG